MVTPGGFIARKENDVKVIDNLVLNLGGCGPFQIRLVVATYSAQLCAVWGILFMVFGNYYPDWQCLDNLRLNGSRENWTTVNWTLSSSVANWTLGDIDLGYGNRSENFTKCDLLRSCREIQFEDSSQTVVTEWGLICENEWAQSFIIILQMVGVLVGAHYGGMFGDRCGRRANLYVSVALHAVFNLIAAFSVDWKMFACLRFFIGLTLGGIFSCCLLYPLEFVGRWWRGILSVLPVWNFGAISFSLIVIMLKNWRHVHIATALFSLLVFLLGFWVPESMKWLLSQGKLERAKNVANMVAALNNRSPPNTTALEIYAKEERKKRRGKESRYQHIRDLFKTDKYFTLSAKMGLIWTCMSLTYYCISFGMKFLYGHFYVNFILFSAAEIPGTLFVHPISRKLGPRLASLIYFMLIISACLGIVIATFVAPEDNKAVIVFILALLAKVNILASWMTMTLFSSLMYPLEVSSLSTDFLNSCARLGSIIAPFILPNFIHSLYVMFLVLGIFLFVSCFLLVSLPVKKSEESDDLEKPKSLLSIIVEETEMEIKVSESEWAINTRD